MALSKYANSPRQRSGSAVRVNEGLPKQSCSRVRKACNRCRLRKVRCDGRIPCTRCDQDHATCKFNHELVGLSDLRKSYIASLEEQQVSLLSALRDLYRKAPDNSDVCDTVEQLQHKGFNIESLRFIDPHRDSTMREVTIENADPKMIPEVEPWDLTQHTLSYVQSLLEPPATPLTVSEFLWHSGHAPSQTPVLQAPHPVRWQSIDTSLGTVSMNDDKSIINPLSGLFIDPFAVSFSSKRSQVPS